MRRIDSLPLRPASLDAVDVLALGEVMLRLDPGERRISHARSFDVWEGGGEYNVARTAVALGHRASVVTALVDNEVGRLIASLIRSGGVEGNRIVWRPFDGIGRSARNGLNFTERGSGDRAPVSVPDRAHSAASLLRPEDVDWDEVLASARWLHTGGVFAALSETTLETAAAAIEAAHRHGTIVSYDANYRPSLWLERGGHAAARAVNRRLAEHCDVVFGHPHDFADLESDAPLEILRDLLPDVSLFATLRRKVMTADEHHLHGEVCTAAHATVSAPRTARGIVDRVGSGDAFAAGVIHGILRGLTVEALLDVGVAAAAHTMTTPGDTPMIEPGEIDAIVAGERAHIRR